MYNRKKAIQYAKKWALSRNPRYYNYDKIGGDCTNFISQCLYSGGLKMDYSKENGWFYINGNKKSPSWTGVDFLRNFLVQSGKANEFLFKKEDLNLEKNILFKKYVVIRNEKIDEGDILQFSKDGWNFTHSLIVTGISGGEIFICCHSKDEYEKNLNEYEFKKIRRLKIIV